MRFLYLILVSSSYALAEDAHGGAAQDYTFEKWLYAGIFVTLLALAWRKYVTPAFAARGAEIRQDLEKASRMKAEADARVREIESRLGNLTGEIEAFRTESRKMIESEGAKIRTETEQLATRIEQRTAKEIEALKKGALAAVQAEVGRHAVDLARQRIARGLDAEVHSKLLSGFLRDLEGSKN